MLPRLRSLLRNLLLRNRMQRDLDDELRVIFDLLVAEKIAQGMQPWEAKRSAAIEMGGVEQLKEKVRDVKMGVYLDTWLSDIKHALRHFRRAPGFAAAAILTLALGIGANTAMFSVLNTLALQRLSIPDPGGLYSLSSYNERGVKRYVPMPTVIDINRASPFIEACGYNGGGIVPVEANRIPGQAIVAFVTGRCFNVFGVEPVLGRAIGDADAPIMTAGEKVIVISDRLWRRHFNRDAGAIGQVMKVDATEAVVIGVMPAGFRGIHADSGIDIFAPPDSLIPAAQGRRPVAQEVLGRLKPGTTFEQASAQFEAMWPALLKEALAANRNAQEGAGILGPIVRLDPMSTGLSLTREQYSQSVRIILGLTALLLLLACVNLGGLLLARLSARTVELGVRLAIGGSRLRIAQQMLIESLLLSGLGTLVALPAAFVFVAPIPSLIDPGLAGWDLTFTPDLRVLSITAVVGFLVGVGLTAIPTWFFLRRRDSVQFSWDRTTTGAASRWTRGLLVAQVALSVVLVIGAALLARSLQAIESADPGVRTENILTARLMSAPGGTRGMVAAAHYAPLLEKLHAIPGVRQISYSLVFPRRLRLIGSDVGFAGEEFTGVRTSLDSVSANFFDMMGIRLVKGRLFTDRDSRQSQRVVILSEALARQLAPDGNILERRLKFQTNRDMQDLMVVGVVANSTQGDLKLTDASVMFSPAMQAPAFSGPNLLLEITGDPTPIADAVRRTVLAHGREFVSDVSMVGDVLARGPARERMSALLSAMIGGLAILLATIGIHGVLAFSVSRRTREIGVRVAIGADPARVATSVIREGVTLTVIGIAGGLPLAFFAARSLRALLFGVSETDFVSFAAAALFFAILGTVAGILPARRAARIHPAITLRAE
jgi:macrolide transport system ATP-binding/permease protein